MPLYAGEQIQAGTGVWANHPTSYSYQWQHSDDGLSSDGNVASATRSDYITVEADLGLYFRVAVTATNGGGSSTVSYSAWVGPVGVAPEPPPDATLRLTPVVEGTLALTPVVEGTLVLTPIT